jgi:hypothetical protein
VQRQTEQRHGQCNYRPFQTGEKVWLEGTNIKTTHPTAKLENKRYGPFPVIKVVSLVIFKLKLPATWKIHDIFHTSLLSPYKETEDHGPNFKEPPPDLIDGEYKYEVEQVLDMRLYG